MDVSNANPQCKIQYCCQCEGVTEYHCKVCTKDLCTLCKEKHNLDLDTKNHEVMISQVTSTFSPRIETCKRHPASVYKVVCEECKIPVCKECTEHKLHEKIDNTSTRNYFSIGKQLTTSKVKFSIKDMFY